MPRQFHAPYSLLPEATATLNLGKDDLRWLEAFLSNLNVSTRATVPTPINATDAATKGYVDGLFVPTVAVVENAEQSVQISRPTTIRLDQADGLVLTNPSAGVARIDLSAIPNAALANSSVTVTAGGGLSGGGAVALGAAVTVSLSTHTHEAGGTAGGTLSAAAITSGALAAARGGTAIDTSASTGVPSIAAGVWSVLSPLTIARGGTNSTTALSNNRIVVSSAGALVEAAAMTNGQLLVGSTGAAPVIAALTAGSNITITNAAGTITIAAAAGALTRTGGNTTEGTTTSTTGADLVTISPSAMVAATPFIVLFNARKSTGAAFASYIGLTLNATVVIDLASSNLPVGTAANAAESAVMVAYIGARVTGYLRSGYILGRGASVGFGAVPLEADAPTADITTIVIRGKSGDAAVTTGADEAHVYALATS